MKQLPLAISPLPATDFEQFVVGPNAHAVQHLRSLRGAGAPVFLWGPAGCGKTRLLQALAAARQRAGERVAWFDADDSLPWGLPEGVGLVVVDRCERLDAERQQAAFALFVDAGSLALQWAAAGRLPPVDLPLLDDMLAGQRGAAS